MKYTATGKLRGQEIEATVINPGDWFGKVWLVEVQGGFESLFYAVEADTVADAMDILAESEEHGKQVRIDLESSEADDYAHECSAGDVIGGVKLTETCKVTLTGKIVKPTDPGYSRLQDPQISGQGVAYDSDHILIHGRENCGNNQMPWRCTYTCDAWENPPENGVSPLELDAFLEKLEEGPVQQEEDSEETEDVDEHVDSEQGQNSGV